MNPGWYPSPSLSGARDNSHNLLKQVFALGVSSPCVLVLGFTTEDDQLHGGFAD